MTAENKAKHSPLPWRFEDKYKDDPKRVVDAEGSFVFGDSCGPAMRDAALIVDAVNEREKMRNLVWRMLPWVERTRDRLCDGQRVHGTENDFSPAIHELTEIIIEANAALGREAEDGQE